MTVPAKSTPISKKKKETIKKAAKPSLESLYHGNNLAAHRLVDHLFRQGWIGSEDGVLVEALYSLAAQVDAHPEAALLWRQYLNVETQVRRKVVNDDDDTLNTLLAELRSEMVDPPHSRT